MGGDGRVGVGKWSLVRHMGGAGVGCALGIGECHTP